MGHSIGFECELNTPGVGNYVEPLIRHGLWNYDPEDGLHRSPHTNHCHCPACQFGNSALRPHTDMSCGGELVSDPMPWPDPETEALLVQLEQILTEQGARPGMNAGFHIHVEYDVTRDGRSDAWSAYREKVVDYFTWFEQQIATFAAQDQPKVRNYNRWLSLGGIRLAPGDTIDISRARFQKHRNTPKGYNLAERANTWEFRIWNSVVEAWRMHLAIDISCAFLDAVADAPHIETAPTTRRPPLLRFIQPYMTEAGFAFAMRHLATRGAGQ